MEAPQAKKVKSSETPVDGKLNERYLTPDIMESVKAQYNSEPLFRHAILPDFFDNDFFENVKAELFKELNEEDWTPLNNDLYTFIQSNDLKHSEETYVKMMKEVVYSETFRSFLQSVTGIELTHTIDMFASRYWNTHHLLCHDDELEGRRIAYIHYFVPEDWCKEDGGALDLFSVNDKGQPSEIMKSITPMRNTFLFFEISPTSFHQVAEVLSENKERLAISGWFYGDPIVRPAPYIEPKLPMKLLDDGKRCKLRDWINPKYLEPKTQRQIAEFFEESSSIELKEFFIEEKSKQVQAALSSDPLPWKKIGPYNRRNYDTLGRWEMDETTTGIARDAYEFFLSPQFGELVRKLTSLDIMEGHVEVRKFKSSNYTLSQDNHDQIQERGLDGYYFICPRDEWDIDVGGQITYMDEDDELLTMIPENNSLSLAYRDAGCMKFVKYVNNQAPGELFNYTMTYLEDPESTQLKDESSEKVEEEQE